MKNKNKAALLLIICCQFLLATAQKDTPKWVEKAKKAVVSVETFDKEGKKLRTGNAFFITETGEAVSDYSLFRDASKGYVTDVDGKQLPITAILGADELYDVVKFKVAVPKKVQSLSMAQDPIPVGEESYILTYSEGKSAVYSSGPVVEVSKLKDSYTYYKLEMPFVISNVSCPVLNASGEVFGLAQADASGNNKFAYAISLAYANSLNIGSSDAFNKTYTAIGIKKAWPAQVDDALISLFLSAGGQNPQAHLETLTDFIATFPNAADGYLNRANHYAYHYSELATTPQAQAELLALATQDINSALKYSATKGDVYYNQAKLIYTVAVSDTTLNDANWSVSAAQVALQKAIGVEDRPIYRQLEADLLFYKQEYEKAFDLYMGVNVSTTASSSSYYWAAKAKQNITGANLNEVVALLDSAVAACGANMEKEATVYLLENVELKMQLEQYKEAVADYDTYYKLVNGQVAAIFYYYREQAKFRLGDLDGALQDIQEALKLSPGDATYYAEQASIYVRQKNFDGALQCIAKALEIEPEFAACYRLRGVCFLRQEKKAEACEAFQKANSLGDPVADKLIKENCK